MARSQLGMELFSLSNSQEKVNEVTIDIADVQGVMDYWQHTLEGQFLGAKSSLIQALSKIASKLGKPLYADPVTTHKERLGFARILVELDVFKPIPEELLLHSPFGGSFLQRIVVEWMPYFCQHCKKLGHEKGNCGLLKKVEPKKGPVTKKTYVAVVQNKGSVENTTQPKSSEQPEHGSEAEKGSQDQLIPQEEVQDPLDCSKVIDPNTTQGDKLGISVHHDSFALRHSDTGGEVVLEEIPEVISESIETCSEYAKGPTPLWLDTGQRIYRRPSDEQKQEVNEGSQWITIKVGYMNNFSGFITFAYGSNDGGERRQLWDHLRTSSSLSSWLILGDFNCVRSTDERISDCPLVLYELDDLKSCLDDVGLDDLSTIALPSGISDHSPLIVTTDPNILSRPKPFQYLNCWGDDPLFMDTVAQVWSTKVSGTAMYQLASRLELLKPLLKNLNKNNFSQLSARVREAQDQLHQCQTQLLAHPTNEILQQEELELNKKYCQLKKSELSMLSQRAKEHDIKAMDANSAYFFSNVAARRNINSIAKV
ncbi:uncharacterized protein LOC141655486 [Silene latifolia]|uniref:uncharacterized protein LOC141655486 n=1 Tax=Silene latifolia TaxID=37657 RepID=UPI003D76E583